MALTGKSQCYLRRAIVLLTIVDAIMLFVDASDAASSLRSTLAEKLNTAFTRFKCSGWVK